MKNKHFFKIIIPCYNSEKYVEKCLMSIENQSFKDFIIICVDDLSDDKTFDIVENIALSYDNIRCIRPDKKLYIGGARNIGIDYEIDSDYTLFVDNDDWMNDDKCLEYIHESIIQNNYPDCIRLPYYFVQKDKKQLIGLNETTPKDLVNSLYIAPWTKCIKSELIVKFPENTLIEDVVQHIQQVDKINTISLCARGIMCWNRDNVNSASLKENQKTLLNGKRISSIYRNIADLMDLQCEHDYCEEHRKWRIDCYKNLVREGKEETF